MKRYLLVATFIAVLAAMATAILAVLARTSLMDGTVPARLDSPRVTSLRPEDRDTPRLALAVAPVISPRNAHLAWGELARYLGERLSLSVDLVQRQTYAEIDTLLLRHEVQVALICTGPYVRLRRQGVVQLLVVPRVRGTTTYRSFVIVRADSPYRSFDDLRGSRFAFSDPLSNSGALYPTFLLHQMGEDPSRFFSRTVYTYSHDRSVLSVAHGDVDAAAVDNLVYEQMTERSPDLAQALRVIHESPEFGTNPIVVGSFLPRETKERLRAVFLGMHENPEGQAVLASLGVDRFEEGDPEAYRRIEEMIDAVE